LAAAWQPDTHRGSSGAWIVDGRLCVLGNHYGYAHVRRELGVDNVSVQCLILGPRRRGTQDEWGPSLFLVWSEESPDRPPEEPPELGEGLSLDGLADDMTEPDEELSLVPRGCDYVQATPGACQGKFLYVSSRDGFQWGSEMNREPAPGWYPYCANWVKISLNPDRVACYASSDGRTWVKDWDLKRGRFFAGPPRYVLLGNGRPGKESLLRNVHPEHFIPSHAGQVFFSDFLVGRD
jgi:hypothetical protein